MELKQNKTDGKVSADSLLIVPYGIETRNAEDVSNVARLLIVPYGIETFAINRQTNKYFLLIVPYGIETQTGKQFLLLS